MFDFTVWLDSTARDKKILGIRFPIGMQNYDNKWTPDFGPRNEESLEGPQPRFAEMLREIEIIGADKEDRNRVPLNNKYGIQLAITEFSSEPVYELKVSLHNLHGQPYAVAATPDETISLGFEMGELDRGKMREQMGGRGGGMGGGRRPGGFGGDRTEMPEPIKVWAKVQLAVQ